MKQSCVKLEGYMSFFAYSVVYFQCIPTFRVLYHRTSVKGGAPTCFIDTCILNESAKPSLVNCAKCFLNAERQYI